MRNRLVSLSLEWEEAFGVAPSITSAISELDAAVLVGFKIDRYTDAEIATLKNIGFELMPTYAEEMQGKSAVRKGYDFKYDGKRYQVKSNRPSGKPGSYVTRSPKPSNLEWDILIYILYDKHYVVQEAWLWKLDEFKNILHAKERLGPSDYRLGLKINIKVPLLSNVTEEEVDTCNRSVMTDDFEIRFDSLEAQAIELNLHKAIINTFGDLIQNEGNTLPDITVLFKKKGNVMFHRIHGAYGGFKIWLDTSQQRLLLYAYGFSRIHEDAGRLFKVDSEKFQLIKIGDKLIIS